MGMLLRIALCLLLTVTALPAQTTTPTIDLDYGLQVDAPNWARTEPRLVGQAFIDALSRTVTDAIHPVGSRATDLPYGVVDLTRSRTGLPTAAQQDELAGQLADGYQTAINPPSKSDRPPSWKRAKVSSVRHDYRNRRFEFDATITYDFIGDHHVRVAGVFNAQSLAVLTLWSDGAYNAQHAAELKAIQQSFRFGAAAAAPPSMKEAFLTKTRWFVGLVIAGVVGLQIWVLVRERRERREAGVA